MFLYTSMSTSGSTQQIVALYTYFYGTLIIIHQSTRRHITVNFSLYIIQRHKTINSRSFLCFSIGCLQVTLMYTQELKLLPWARSRYGKLGSDKLVSQHS